MMLVTLIILVQRYSDVMIHNLYIVLTSNKVLISDVTIPGILIDNAKLTDNECLEVLSDDMVMIVLMQEVIKQAFIRIQQLLFLITSLKTDLRMVLVWLFLDNTSNNILWDILLIPFLDVTRKSDLTQ